MCGSIVAAPAAGAEIRPLKARAVRRASYVDLRPDDEE
jgi:hypothetical protein